MKIVNVEQGTAPWHAWRADKWMASEASIVMGVAPSSYEVKSWIGLMLSKGGLGNDPTEWSERMLEFGHEHEAAALARVNASDRYDVPFAPVCGETEQPGRAFAASFDGYLQMGPARVPEWVEIKCPTSRAKWHHNLRYWGDIPEHHRTQMLAQFATLDVDEAVGHFVVGGPNGGAWITHLFRRSECEDAIEELASEWRRFWSGETQHTIPTGWPGAVRRYQAAHAAQVKAKVRMDEARARLLELADGREVYGFGASIKKQVTKGRLSETLMKADGIDANKYRGKPTESWVVRLNKEEDD